MEISFSGPGKSACSVGLVCCALVTLLNCRASEPVKVIELWPNGAPGEKGNIGEERDTTKPTDALIAGKPVIRLGNVSKPTIRILHQPQTLHHQMHRANLTSGGKSSGGAPVSDAAFLDWARANGAVPEAGVPVAMSKMCLLTAHFHPTAIPAPRGEVVELHH